MCLGIVSQSLTLVINQIILFLCKALSFAVFAVRAPLGHYTACGNCSLAWKIRLCFPLKQYYLRMLMLWTESNMAMYNTSMLQQCVQCLLNATELFIVSPIKPWKEKKVFTINNKQYILHILC